MSEQELMELKVRIVNDLKASLPQEITFKFPDSETTIPLLRHTVSSSPGYMNIVSVAYVPPGASNIGQLIRTIIEVNKPIPSTGEIIKDILKGAAQTFSSVPRVVVARSPQPIPVDQWMQNSLTDTTDRYTPEKAPDGWSNTKGETFQPLPGQIEIANSTHWGK
jgi:hypothetical protein